MMNLFKSLFEKKESVDYTRLLSEGAQIVDVRSPGEFGGGHIRGSVNIPLPDLKNNVKKISRQKPVITCCASGMRSSSAKSILLSLGYTNVHNGGGWINLQNRL